MRVLVIADNLLARTGLATLLTTQTDLDVVGQVASSDSLSDDIDVYRPDTVIYDLGYDPLTHLSRLDQLVDIPVVALIPDSEQAAAAAVGALARSGAYGLLLRDTQPEILATALMTVYRGLVVLDPELTPALIAVESTLIEPPTEALTPREVEVLQLLAEGLPNKLIAQQLSISPNTVKFHINAIMTKLDAQSRTEAVVRATRLGLVIL